MAAEARILKIAVLGASGRLGRLIMAEIIRRPDLELVAGVVRHDSVMLGADLGELSETALVGIETSVSMRDAADAADFVIDVSAPAAFCRLCPPDYRARRPALCLRRYRPRRR